MIGFCYHWNFHFFPFYIFINILCEKSPDLFDLKVQTYFLPSFLLIGGCILEAFLKFRLLSNQFQNKQRPETFPTFTTVLCLIAADMQSFSSCLMLRYMLYFLQFLSHFHVPDRIGDFPSKRTAHYPMQLLQLPNLAFSGSPADE